MAACICNHGWRCERHPARPWPHDDCVGPGVECMLADCPYGARAITNKPINDAVDRGLYPHNLEPNGPRSIARPAVEPPASKSRQTSLTATITCPLCHHRAEEHIPAAACLYFYTCTGCGERLKPTHGDCCVFCSYANRGCPFCQ